MIKFNIYNVRGVFYVVSLSMLSFLNCSNSESSGNFKPESKRIKNVVIIGNSIVTHPHNKELGWEHDWGMAASKRDSDFVHLLMSKIHIVDKNVNVRYLSIASFEREYDDYDLTQLSKFRDADMLILKISENVDSQTIYERKFIYHYDKLVKYLASTDSTVKIVVDGFWPSPVNKVIEEYAMEHNYPFVTIQDLYSNDYANSARGLFMNEGVANHPSDQGMRNIAVRIWDCISKYFL